MSTDALMVLTAVIAGAGVGVLVQVARRKATWLWRTGAAVVGLAGVAIFVVYLVRDGGSVNRHGFRAVFMLAAAPGGGQGLQCSERLRPRSG